LNVRGDDAWVVDQEMAMFSGRAMLEGRKFALRNVAAGRG
jgi:hypothetical protein